MKTSRFLFCLILFVLSVSNTFSQVNELEIFIPLEEIECDEDDKTIPERDLYLFTFNRWKYQIRNRCNSKYILKHY